MEPFLEPTRDEWFQSLSNRAAAIWLGDGNWSGNGTFNIHHVHSIHHLAKDDVLGNNMTRHGQRGGRGLTAHAHTPGPAARRPAAAGTYLVQKLL